MSVRKKVSQVFAVLERFSPFVTYAFGVIFILDALFGWFALSAIAQHPDVFLLVVGFILWSTGSSARDAQKRVSRLQRQLKSREEHIEALRTLREDGDEP